MQQLKKHDSTGYNKELKHLNDLRILFIEQLDLLNQLNAGDISQLENDILKKTGFTNIQASANLLGFEAQYNRIIEIEKLINGKITPADLTTDREFKKSFLNKLKESFNIYYTDSEKNLLERLKRVTTAFNELSIEDRQHLVINRNGLQINPFSYLVR